MYEVCQRRARAYFERCPALQLPDAHCGSLEDAYRAYSCIKALDIAQLCYEGREAEARQLYGLPESWSCET